MSRRKQALPAQWGAAKSSRGTPRAAWRSSGE